VQLKSLYKITAKEIATKTIEIGAGYYDVILKKKGAQFTWPTIVH